MRWFAAAASVVLIGVGAEARAESAAPAEVSCAAVSRADLENGRPVRCEVALDLRGEPLGPPAEPEVVKVPRRAALGVRNALPQVVEPAAPKLLGVWSGAVVLRAQPSEPATACNRPESGDAIFPNPSRKAATRVAPVIEELGTASCTRLG